MSNALLRFDAAVEDLLAMREFNPENIKPDEGCKDTLFELKGIVDTGVISSSLARPLPKGRRYARGGGRVVKSKYPKY